jgi:hypothetical protein
MRYKTEEEIEIAVENKMNKLDRNLMSGLISQEEYDEKACDIERWAEYYFDLLAEKAA